MLGNQYKTIKKSGLFDEIFYLKTYEDIRKSDTDPIKHYIKHGWKEGRNPSSSFDTKYYLEQNPDVKEASICPLAHKIKKDKKYKKIAFLNTLKTIISNAWVLRKHINIHNIKKFIHHARKGNFSFINEKILMHSNVNIPQAKLDLINKMQEFEFIEFEKTKNPLVSIVIPVYNQFEFTYKCLRSILDNTKDVEYEIIIADDVSSDETVHIKKYAKNITVVRNEKNLGFLLNCNKAAKIAKGKYIHFLNNDTQVQKEWLSSLVELIESDKKIGMVGSKLVYADGRQQEAGGIIWQDGSGWNYGMLDDPTKPEYNYVKEADYISGASILIKKDLWQKIGGFDERYVPAYYEDSDLAFEVRKHGFRVMFQPKSIVVHFEGISHGTDTNTGIKSYQIKNKEKFVEKWQDELEKNHFPNAENVFLARDRSKDKKHILIIDHYVPHFDQDAGSRTIFGYIKLFSKHNYNITFIGDNYYKHEPYSTIIEQMGVEILYGNWYANHYENWLSVNAKYFEYVLLSRPHISEKYIDILKKSTDAKLVYYGHDLHFLREEREYILTGEKQKKDVSIKWKKREFALMQKVDISLYPSQTEVDIINNIDKNIKIKAIPAYLFESFDSTSKDFLATSDIMFVGGFSHTPNIDAMLWFVKDIWSKIEKQLPNIKLYIIGSKPPREILDLQRNNIMVTGFVSDDELKKYYQKCRISVVPLRYGAGIKGKVVEALYEQMPIITTTIGAEGLEDVQNYMIIEDKAQSFAQSLLSLYNNNEKWEELSKNGKIYCKKYFSYESATRTLSGIFEF